MHRVNGQVSDLYFLYLSNPHLKMHTLLCEKSIEHIRNCRHRASISRHDKKTTIHPNRAQGTTAQDELLTFPESRLSQAPRALTCQSVEDRLRHVSRSRSARCHRSGGTVHLTRAARRDPPGWRHAEHRSRVPVVAETAPAR